MPVRLDYLLRLPLPTGTVTIWYYFFQIIFSNAQFILPACVELTTRTSWLLLLWYSPGIFRFFHGPLTDWTSGFVLWQPHDHPTRIIYQFDPSSGDYLVADHATTGKTLYLKQVNLVLAGRCSISLIERGEAKWWALHIHGVRFRSSTRFFCFTLNKLI